MFEHTKATTHFDTMAVYLSLIISYVMKGAEISIIRKISVIATDATNHMPPRHTALVQMAETASIVLDIAGPRGGLTKETAVELAAPVLVDNKQDFTGLRLSTWAFCEESAEVFASVIDKLPELKAAHLADIIAGRPMAEGVRVYEVLSAALAKKQLHLIDLSDNAVGPSGIAALRPMLAAQEELKELFLSNVGLSAECCRDVADMMTFRTPTKLTRLILHNNMSGSDGAIAIADIVKASPVLEDFQFSASRGGAEGGEALASALAATSSLKRLDLHDNTFGAETGRLLGITLAKQSSLSHLNIADIGTYINSDGAHHPLKVVLQVWRMRAWRPSCQGC